MRSYRGIYIDIGVSKDYLKENIARLQITKLLQIAGSCATGVEFKPSLKLIVKK